MTDLHWQELLDASPQDISLRAAYADWLLEQGKRDLEAVIQQAFVVGKVKIAYDAEYVKKHGSQDRYWDVYFASLKSNNRPEYLVDIFRGRLNKGSCVFVDCYVLSYPNRRTAEVDLFRALLEFPKHMRTLLGVSNDQVLYSCPPS